jgi:amino acid adenylation domain-containing protein
MDTDRDRSRSEAMRAVLEQELAERARVQLQAGKAAAANSVQPPAAAASDVPLRLASDVCELAITALGIPAERFDPDQNLASYGVDSIAITELMAQISRRYGVSIAPTTFFEARHLTELCRILHTRYGDAIARHYERAAMAAAPAMREPAREPVHAAAVSASASDAATVAGWISRHQAPARKPRAAPLPAAAARAPAAVPVAIISMEGMFPGSPDLEAFRQHLRNGDDCIEEIPASRWDWRALWGDPRKGPFTTVKHGGFVAGHDLFDAPFFHISRKEAELMDPQHRLFIECVWKLIEGAGQAPGSLADRKVGIFLGINLQDYVDLANRAGLMDAVQMTGLGHVFCPNRLSFLLGLTGPSQVIDTACSSSLVAVHRAVMSIRHEGCEMAIAGGSNLMLTPTQHLLFSQTGMLAADGRCKTFSAAADGYARAEGVGAVLLKRLDLAERDGDTILAVIRGSAENHGGAGSSLTAPNPRAQAQLIVEAHTQAGIDPRSVTLIECHGTGTRLGDPVEIEGLKTAFAQLYRLQGVEPPAQPHCALGSVKSNIGHAETAAGIAGLIKVVLAMQDGVRYRSLHCKQPNPLIELAQTPFRLLDSQQDWNRPVVDGVEQPRRAGVSSFGAGGANAHLVLEEYRAPASPAGEAVAVTPHPMVVPLSARDEPALRAAAEALQAWLQRRGPLAAGQFESLVFTLQTGRDAMRARLACVAADADGLSRQLASFLSGAGDGPAHGMVKRGAGAIAQAAPATALAPAAQAASWVAGAQTDWLALWQGRRPRRMALPTYSFQRQRYWLPVPVPVAPPAPASVSATSMLRESAPGCFTLALSGAEFFLADHRVQGRSVLPGVAYLELAREAAQRSGLVGFLIRKVVWLRPLEVVAPVTLDVRLLADSSGWPRVEIASTGADGAALLHMQARLGPAQDDAQPPVALPALQAAHPRQLDVADIYRGFDAMGLRYGPAHRVLQSLATGQGESGARQVLAQLQLPAVMTRSVADFVLHPGLLDGALQACIGMAPDQEGGAIGFGPALPFALESLEILAPCTSRMWVHVRSSPAAAGSMRALDLDLLDQDGALCVRLRGFAARAPDRNPQVSTLLFEPRWEAAPALQTVAPGRYARRLALVCQPGPVAPGELAGLLPQWECQALASAQGPGDQAFIDCAAQLLDVLQAVVRAAPPAPPPVLLQVLVVASSAGPQPQWTALTGMLRSARLEHPWLCCQLVVVVADAAGSVDAATAAAALLQDAGAPQRVELRHVGAQTQLRCWRESAAMPSSADAAPAWRADGVYLVTGGAGAIGRLLAFEIVARCPGAAIVLAGRSALQGEAAQWLAALQAGGASLSYRQCDMADAQAVDALVAGVLEQHGRLTGVFHAAGLLRDGLLAGKSRGTLAEVLAPKVSGAANLDRAIGNTALDFFVLFGSLSGVFGNAGQADYATANAYLDVFAAQREAQRAIGMRQGRTVAIDWPVWREGGMRMEPAAVRLMRQTTGLAELDCADAIAAMVRALASGSPQVLVAAGDAARVQRYVLALNAPAAPAWAAAAAAPEAPAATAAVDQRALRARLLAELMRSVGEQLKVAQSDLDPEVELAEYGFDSISFTQFANQLNDRFGLEITPTLFFEHPGLGALADSLVASDGAKIAAQLGLTAVAVPPTAQLAPAPAVPAAAPAIAPAAAVAAAVAVAPAPGANDGVAIIGLAGVFPQAHDIAQYWQNLVEGRDCISEVPADRWDWREWWGDPQTQAGRTNVKWGGFIDGMAQFDPLFFGLSPREARAMDPQQRLLLTQAWRVMEHAGYAPRSLAGSNTAVFIGTADTGYGRLLAQAGAGVEGYSMTGLAPSLGPNRISFQFDFHGPSVAVETACSSALVAIHRAAEAIRGGSCDTAIAGGVNALLLPEGFVGFTRAGMLAPDGRCKPFSAQANGYARGEGVGLVFLKRLEHAQRDGDRILGVIRASAENHGGRAGSLTAPNPKAQAELLRSAWRRSNIDPRTVSYIEAHGTGTPLGDPIEVEALGAAFADLEREADARLGPMPAVACGIGSVKSNIGHLELAAGVAGLAKVLLQMQHGTLAPTLHCDQLNPYLKLDGSRFQVVRERRPWTRPLDADGAELPRRAGVSSFGFGGSNAHLVIEEYRAPVVPEPPAAAGPVLIVLSARSPEQLSQWAGLLAEAITDAMPLASIAFTLQCARDAMEHRVAFLASSHTQLRARLAACASGPDAGGEGIYGGRVNAYRDTLAILDSDDEMRRAVASLPERGKHDSLLQLWVRGLKVDWLNLYQGRPTPRKLDLPGYPFATASYWVEAAAASAPGPVPVQAAPPAAAPMQQPTAPVAAQSTNGFARALEALTLLAAQVLEVEAAVLEPDTELGDYGFDSITMTGFATQTNAAFGLALTPADFFEFATLARLARHLADAPAFSAGAAAAAPLAPVAPVAPEPAALAPPQQQSAGDDPVVIVGLSCRLPMAADADAFWRNLADGKDCISPIPADRWDWRAVDGDPKTQPGRTNIHWAGFIDGVFEFDPLFFGISPREAMLMDPQQRLLLMHVWKALEDAGHAPRSFGGRPVGLFVGTAASGYGELPGDDAGGDGYAATGAVASVGPNRVSYFLDWHGPSEPIETACSSSLVALHRAVQAMDAGDCDMAVVGGVNTIVTPAAHINFAKAGMLSVDGRCKTFAAEANGYARGEGVATIVLRRLSHAVRDGDHVYAIVRGSAVNHGGRANSLTAPNTAAQAAVLKAAYARAGVDPASVTYVEAHGTGTPLGDPVEINALKSVFRPPVEAAAAGCCGVGSVKTNIGHLELAAGLAGVIKVLLQMRHRTLAPSLHSVNQNPYVDFAGSPFFIVRELQPWLGARDAGGRELPLRAGVSSFGFGGVNAHVVLEEGPAQAPAAPLLPGARMLVPLSARDPERLRDQALQLASTLASGRFADADLGDLAWTLQVGREAMQHRLALVAGDLAQLRAGLQDWLAGRRPAPANGSLEQVAAQWVGGAQVDWARQHDGPRRRLALPTYPFARDRYRVGEVAASPAAATAPGPVARPLARLAADGSVALALDGSAFYLADHRVNGARVLPGAMSLELARAAHQLAAGSTAFAPATLEQVVWLAPVIAGAGPFAARLLLEQVEGGRSRFQLRTGDAGGAGGTLHAQGMVGALRGELSPPRLDLAALRGRCTGQLTPASAYERYAALGLDYGPAYRAIAELLVGDGEVLARLQLPPSAAAGQLQWGAHPVMLDAAFQSCLGLFAAPGSTQAALPFAVEALHVLRPTTNAMWASVRSATASGAVRRIDIDLADADGAVCVQVRGFSLRLLDPARGPAAAARVTASAATASAVGADVAAHERARAVDYLVRLVAAESGVAASAIEPSAALDAYGIDSIMITRLTDRLERDFGALSKTLFFEHQTVLALADHFISGHGARLAQVAGGAAPADFVIPAQANSVIPAQAGIQGIPAAPPQEDRVGDIAIVGLAGRYPGAGNLQEFWANLAAGRDSIIEVPAARWDHSRYYDPAPGTPGKTNSKWGGFIDGFDRFDPLFFNIAPREAQYIDPQERLFLECAWEAIEDAGHTRASLGGTDAALPGANVGVFVGVMYEEYQLYGAESTQRGQPLALPGSPASIANRVSYFFNFHGPSMAVDTMCSSSLSAIHLACDSLRAGSCDVALAGGVNLTLHPNKYLALAQGRFTSSRGRCESFGASGDGYVPGEGVGAVLLKPLARALADGDQVYGVIRGSALNHGGKTNGYSVPNPHAQTAVVAHALARAGIAAGAISYVEAHGTGTSLGDPIEIAALTRAFGAHGREPGSCAIGSIKSNIGHCESASGIAGLTKVLLQMKHGQLVPSLHSATLNPRIDFAGSPFVVQQQLAPWSRRLAQTPQGPRELPRIAGVSSFGAGGSNAHLLIEEYVPAPQSAGPGGQTLVFPVSAREAGPLRDALARLREAVSTLQNADLAAVAHVLQGREAFEVRVAIVAPDRPALLAALDALLAGQQRPGVYRKGSAAPADAAADRAACAWLAGERVDWAQLRQGPQPRRISLPTYPFARERYWVPGSAAPAAADGPAPLLFAPRWEAQSAGTHAGPPARTLVVLCEPAAGAAQVLAAALADAECVVLDARAGEGSIAARFTEYATGLLALVQRLARERRPGTLLQVVVPLQGEQALLEGLSGLLRTAAQETAGLRCQLVAVESGRADLAALLRREQSGADAQVRYDAAQRLVRRWQELPPASAACLAAPLVWKDGGVYLITGGTGGVGLLLAEEVARRARRPVLCLTSRSPLPPEAHERLAALPATVLHRQVDVTSAPQTGALVRELQASYGRIDGIVHVAGLNRDKLILRKSDDELREVLAPKVSGLCHLDAASADCDLDFMLLFASVSGALGNAGQADYATANAFMDGFAGWRNRLVERGERRGATLAIDWPYWQDGGMRLDQATLNAMRDGFGVAPLETAAAMAALQRCFAAGEAQALVLAGDHQRLRAAMAAAGSAAAAPPQEAAPVPAPQTALREQTLAYLGARFGSVLDIPAARIEVDTPIDRYGIDSVLALQLIEAIERDLGALPRTLLFEYPTIALLAQALLDSHRTALEAMFGMAAAPLSAAAAAAPAAAQLQLAPSQPRREDIAVIAVAGRYPGADSIEEFWTVLREGRDCVTEIPPERWDHAPLFSPEKGKRGTSYCKWGGFLAQADCFDAAFFGITPRDAMLMDPQERLFLQTAWHLLERAGHTREQLQRQYESRVGVYVGAMYHPDPSAGGQAEDRMLVSLASHASIANRVSFWFDLQGPSVAVDTMCSSGLHAVHHACRSLQLGECRLAIAGGVNLTMHPNKYLGLSRAGMLGSHPGSRSFADGDGYLPAEGVGAVLLKPLADALRDGDPVLAVIKASAINHAGRSAGFGVPSAQAQARLVEENFRASGIDPRTVGYVEAAANGSALGDAIEVRALARAFRAFTPDTGFCAIGSVKSNMGHAESASGMAQLTKVLLQLEHRQLVPSVRHAAANPDVQFDGTPFVLQSALEPWRGRAIDGVEGPLRAAISSFGAGGSNVHLIMEEAPAATVLPAGQERRRDRRFVLTARDPQRLAEVASLLHDHLRAQPALSLAALSQTLCHRREAMECSVQLVAADRAELLALLAKGPPWPAPDPARLQAATDAPAATTTGLPPLVLPGYPFARDRHALAPATITTHAEPALFVAPAAAAVPASEPLLQQITRLMGEELGLAADAIRPAASFRDHGADSMFALRLIHTLSDVAGIVVSNRDLERHPTPLALAQFAASLAPRVTPPVEAAAWPAQPMPLSEGQTSLWVLQQLYPALTGYNVPLAFRVEGIGRVALERTCRFMLERFPVLASVIDDRAVEPRLVARAVEAPLQLLSVPPAQDDLAFARERAMRPFALAVEAPIRFELLRGSGEILLVVVHHIVFDGVSAACFERTFWDAYERFFTGREPPAQPPETQYAGFVAWERALLQSAQGQADLDFWKQQLAGELPVLRLPCDRPPSGAVTLAGCSVDTHLPAERLHAARQCAATLGISLASFFLGVLNVLLYRYAGQEDVLVAMPTAGRPSRRFEQVIGYFANLILVRTRLSGSMSAASLLQQTHAQVVDCLDHAAYPFPALARQLPQPASGTALYQVSYSFQNFLDDLVPGSVVTVGGTRITHLPQLRQEGDGAFGIELVEEGERLRLVAGFDPGQFDESTARRMLGHFMQLVESVSADPSAAIASLEMLAPDERRALALWSRGPALPVRDGTVVEWIRQQALATPDAPALVAAGQRLGYGELARQAHRLASHLLARGVTPGARVGVLLGRGVDSIVALLAVLQAGATWVPLEADDPDRRLSLILEDAGVAAIVTDSAGEARLATLAARVPLLVQLDRERGAIGAAEMGSPLPDIAPDSDAYVIYTSGSTGRPKGVAVTHRAIGGHCLAVIDRYALTSRDWVLQFASHGVDAALEQILPTLACGACLVLREAALWSPAQLRRVLDEHPVTVADLPPAYLREVLQAWADDPAQAPAAARSPRLLIVGGEVLPPATVQLWRQSPLAGARLLNAYGPTEATVTCTVHEVGSEPLAAGAGVPIGRPLAGGEVVILDRDGNPVPEGVPGELHLGGMRVARGYHRQPELTRERFIANQVDGAPLYRSGDVGWFIPGSNGLIALRGRIDQQVKIRGFRVEPAEIEAALRESGIKDALVLASAGSDGNTVLTAYLAAPAGIDEAALRSELATRLPACMLPAAFVVLDALPLTAGGKIDRAALAAPTLARAQAASAAPRSTTEERLLALWRSVLDCRALGVHDDFFRSGGHSLLALRLLAAVQREFGRELAIGDLLRAPSVAQQAVLLAGAPGGPAATAPAGALVQLAAATPRARGGREPLFLVHPVGGNVACYLELARQLDLGRPVYGLQAGPASHSGIEAMAAAYLAAVREVQASGPYHLAGWSLGGVVAYEMAQQLRRAGEEVDFLGLIDSYTPALLEKINVDPGADPGDEVFRNNALALRAYRPQPHAGTLTLLATAQGRQIEPTLGWGALAEGALVLHPLPGDHYTLMQAPQLQRLVELLENLLGAARPVAALQASS